MAKKSYLPIEVPEELWIPGYGAEDDDYANEFKKDNLDLDNSMDPAQKHDLEDLDEYIDGTLVFKYKLVGVGKINKTASVKWNK